ncbi:MAG TPA: hypothetical protein VG125_32045 [Pirellulales bacterium]|nr:hypothetical protein [Pirellulales bacterium]
MPLFDALVEFASPAEAVELICRISSSNVPLPPADEPLLEPVAAVLVGVVPVLLKLEPTVDVPELSAPVADVAPELAAAEVSIPEPAVGGEPDAGEPDAGEPGAGPGGGPPSLPPTPCPANCCWTSLKSVCTSFNKVWKSVPSDELLELDDETLVADESVPLFDALVEFASPAEAAELSCRISSSNVPLPLADEPLLEPVAAVLVGLVPVLLLIEKVN